MELADNDDASAMLAGLFRNFCRLLKYGQNLPPQSFSCPVMCPVRCCHVSYLKPKKSLSPCDPSPMP